MNAKTSLRLRLFLAPVLGAGLTACAATGEVSNRGPATLSAAGTYLAANFAASEGDLESAAALYAETLRNDPDNSDILARALIFATSSGDMKSAVPLAARVAAKIPENRPAQLVLTISAIQRQDYAEALGLLQRSRPGAFSGITNAILEAWARAGLGNGDDALKALEKLRAQPGMEAMHTYHRALLLDFLGRTREAETSYKQALAEASTAPRAADGYGRFLARQGRAKEALAVYAKLGADSPGQPVPAHMSALISSGQAVEPLIRTPADGAAEALFGVAASVSGENGSDVAVMYFNLATYLRPDFDLARVLLADRLERRGKLESANALYLSIPESSPYRSMVAVQAAVNQARLGEREKAIALVRDLSEKQPDDPEIWTALGDLYRGDEKFTESAAAYDKAIATANFSGRRKASLLYARGVSLHSAGNWDKAEADFTAALEIDPDRPEILNYLGYSWVEQGKNLEQALAMLEKARALRPLDGYIADSVGWAYFKLGRYKEAADALENAVLLSPDASEVQDHLGDAYWRIGRKIDARFQWSHALALVTEPEAKAVLERKIKFGLDAASASK